MSQQEFSELEAVISAQANLLAEAQVPIITVSATYRKELLKQYQCFSRIQAEAVFSRAHYSMAEAVYQAASKKDLTSHVFDPTNFVATNDWSKIDFTEFVGQQMARHKPLKWLKDQIDTVARNKLPITDAITPPLEAALVHTDQPIIALHYEAGTIAARNHKRVVQVLTDPHVRPQYLDALPLKAVKHQTPSQSESHKQVSNNQITFAVFDKSTKDELLSKAESLNKQLSEDQIEITGPPVDPRISRLASQKLPLAAGKPLQLAVTTGGLGTNLAEIKAVLKLLAPMLTVYPEKIRLFLYAGTHRDFRNFYEEFAEKNNLRIGNIDDQTARIRVLYEDSIVDANENLITHMFPWADAILTKPSGDMAYEAVAAGIVPLFLEPWGEWEENIQERLVKLGVAYDFNSENAYNHLTELLSNYAIAKAQTISKQLPANYRHGSENIIKLQRSLL